MLKRQFCLPIMFVGAAVLSLGMGTACGQGYPSRPIRIITGPSGSGTDIASRLITQSLAAPLGQPVIVDNRPAGVIPIQAVQQSQPDGYTVLYSASALWLGPFLRKSAQYDPVRDFQPITQTTRQPALLVVPPTLPAKSVKELIALAKARPGELNYATANLGSLNHLSAELFNSMAGIKTERILYSTGPQAISDLVAGRAHLLFGTVSLVSAQVKAGKLRPLAVSSAQPTELAPGIPTLAASGLPGFESMSHAGMFVPAKTPREIVGRLNQEIVRALLRPEVKEKFFATGVDTVGSSPEQFESVIRHEMTTMGKLIKDLGITED